MEFFNLRPKKRNFMWRLNRSPQEVKVGSKPSWFSRKAKYLAVVAALLLALANGTPVKEAVLSGLGAIVTPN